MKIFEILRYMGMPKSLCRIECRPAAAAALPPPPPHSRTSVCPFLFKWLEVINYHEAYVAFALNVIGLRAR
jgi:hypothetical protein